MIDNIVPGISTVITGAMLRFIRSTISRKTSGEKVFIDRLKAIHGPWNIPAVSAERRMLMSSQVFIANPRFHDTPPTGAVFPQIRLPCKCRRRRCTGSHYRWGTLYESFDASGVRFHERPAAPGTVVCRVCRVGAHVPGRGV